MVLWVLFGGWAFPISYEGNFKLKLYFYSKQNMVLPTCFQGIDYVNEQIIISWG